MTKSIQQVKQNLENLESQVGQSATELQELRRDYLKLLSQSLKQQLIFACYQICTQFYPQSFIDLSLSAKQNLQQSVREFGSELEPQLIELLEQTELEPEPIELNLMAELIKKLPRPKSTGEGKGELSPADLELVKAEIANIENIENLEDIELIAIETSADEDSSEEGSSEESSSDITAIPETPELEIAPEPPKEQINFNNPEHLILWHKQIERGIKRTLDDTSRRINKLLQKSAIVPHRLPNKVIEVAMQTDGSKGMRGGGKQPKVPHVMHLAIESDREKKSKSKKSSMQVSLLRLRLAEVEFADHLLNAKRGQIRKLMGKIKQLNGQYKEIQQDLAIIEAQAAWRSSWYED